MAESIEEPAGGWVPRSLRSLPHPSSAQPGIEPTNNYAERLVRHGVLWRKSSFGSDSENGFRFVGRILTTVATLRLQKRNVLDYVEHACRAALLGHPALSLLPPRDPSALVLAHAA